MPTQPTLPSRLTRSIIVIGGNLAGLRTVDALRSNGFDGEITVVSDESLPPYDRPPLSKSLLANDEPVFFADDINADLDALASHVLYATRAVALAPAPAGDAAGSGWRVTVAPIPALIHDDSPDSQRVLTADAVVLAVGSSPVRPTGWENTSRLYTWDDAVTLRAQLTRPGKVVIIGAGWIGSEVASVAASAGHEVSVLEAFPTPLFRQLGEVVGRRVASWFEDAGVDLHTGARVSDVLAAGQDSPAGDGALVGAVGPQGSAPFRVVFSTAQGTTQSLDADMVLAAVGARPNTSWLEGSLQLSESGAVPTDEWGRVIAAPSSGDAFGSLDSPASLNTTLPGLFAVGDCALRRDAVHTLVAGGHWNTALTDPDRVAQAVLAQLDGIRAPEHAPATPTPYVFSTQFDRDVNLYGTPDLEHDEVAFRDVEGSGWSALYLRQDGATTFLTGVFTVNTPRDAAQARKLLAGGPVVINPDLAIDSAKQLKLALVRG